MVPAALHGGYVGVGVGTGVGGAVVGVGVTGAGGVASAGTVTAGSSSYTHASVPQIETGGHVVVRQPWNPICCFDMVR